MEVKSILVVRFRQMGDAILSTVVLNTLRYNFPHATIDFVLNERIAPLFEGHPSADHLLTFSDKERHHVLTYCRKVWKTVHIQHYDIIIDMRSTLNTMLFALFSPQTPYRIGFRKVYTRWVFNHCIIRNEGKNMIDQDLSLLMPLEQLKPLTYERRFSLSVSEGEKNRMHQYLIQSGINLELPIMLVGVTAKLPSKVWPETSMIQVLRQVLTNYPNMQLIFNYAPGQEEDNARRICRALDDNPHIFINVKACSPRELFAMSHFITLYFGNEGGARHIVHAACKPSFVICAPSSDKKVWLPVNDIPALGISVSDVTTTEERAMMSYIQQYEAITPEQVWLKLQPFINSL